MKKIIVLTLALALIIGAFSGCGTTASENASQNPGGSAQDSKPTVIKIACGLAEGTPMVVGSQKFEETLEKLTDGRYDVQVYANAELGDDTRVTEAVSMGTLEMCCTTPSVFSGICDQIGLFDLPFLFTSTEGADEVFDGEIGASISKTVETNGGVHVLGYFENGFRCVTNSKHEIVTPDDLKGLKIRTPESDVFLATFNALGANPTPMAFSEVFTALQQGTIDGQENPLNTIYLNKFYEVQGYVTRTGHIYGPHMFIVNSKLYNSLSDEDKAAFDEAAGEAVKANRELSRELDEDYAQKLRDAGMAVTELSPEQKAVWQEAVAPVYEQFSDKIGADLIARVQEIMAKHN